MNIFEHAKMQLCICFVFMLFNMVRCIYIYAFYVWCLTCENVVIFLRLNIEHA
jgi:hypothetical protein